MADTISKQKKAGICPESEGNTKPKKLVRSILFKMGYRFRIHVKSLPRCLDIVLKKNVWVRFIFFWHENRVIPTSF
ncbi:hypothetical protein ACFL35_17000 [Candidatus Riflebacteria bacterium]